MSKVLLELTEEHLETGLRGIPVGYCPTSSVDPQKGLFYVGRPVYELAEKDPYEVIYLLFHGKEGSSEELQSFRQDLEKRASLSQKLLDHICSLPREGHPMKLLSASLLLCGMLEGTGDYLEDCLNIIAKMPHIVASLINHHAAWGKTPDSDPSKGYMENFTDMLQVPNCAPRQLFEIFRLYNVLHFDHGGGNLSTFTAKVIASGKEDLYGALSGAMSALAGPLHGKANQDTLHFLERALDSIGEDITEENVEKYLRGCQSRKELFYGFGHAVLRVEDPRATVQYDLAEKLFPSHPLIRLALLFRKVGPRLLSENKRVSNPFPNVDAISGSLLTAAGFPYPEYYTVLFGLSRCVGISIQLVYERLQARNGKGTPIVRPKFFYRPREGS